MKNATIMTFDDASTFVFNNNTAHFLGMGCTLESGALRHIIVPLLHFVPRP